MRAYKWNSWLPSLLLKIMLAGCSNNLSQVDFPLESPTSSSFSDVANVASPKGDETKLVPVDQSGADQNVSVQSPVLEPSVQTNMESKTPELSKEENESLAASVFKKLLEELQKIVSMPKSKDSDATQELIREAELSTATRNLRRLSQHPRSVHATT